MNGLGSFVCATVWYAAVAVVAGTAACVQLDRQSRNVPSVAILVPEPFQSDALEYLIRQSIDRNDSAQGETLARRLVGRRPIPAEVLSLYARALLANGKEDAGVAALQIAASRGWRDRFVQRVAILSALHQGAPEIAANRVVGLWRLGERGDWLMDLTRATFEAPGGTSAFEATLIDRDRYLGTDFLSWAANSLPFAIVDRLARRMARLHGEFDCGKFSAQAERLIKDGRLQAAAAVWSAFCSSSHQSSGENLNFDSRIVIPGPFDWRYPESPGVDVEIRQDRDAAVLHYSSSDPLLRVIARRYLSLSAGPYVLKVDSVASYSAVKWSVACVPTSTPKAEVTLDPKVEGQWSFVVPANCPFQELSIAARSGSGDVGPINFLHSGDL